jgi:thiol:disulfide interchange protein DsbA
MKKFAVWLFLALAIPLQACAQEQWVEGENYTVLDEPATATPEIKEFFSFWCPHCYNYEPVVKDLKSQLDKGTQFHKVHVNFMPNASKDTQDDATRGMMIAKALKQDDKLIGAIFNYLHKQRASITDMKDIRNIFAINGVDTAEFDKLANSFGVNSQLKRNNKILEDYRNYVHSVPSFIVNGKYMARFTRGMTQQDQIDLLIWLTKQK